MLHIFGAKVAITVVAASRKDMVVAVEFAIKLYSENVHAGVCLRVETESEREVRM